MVRFRACPRRPVAPSRARRPTRGRWRLSEARSKPTTSRLRPRTGSRKITGHRVARSDSGHTRTRLPSRSIMRRNRPSSAAPDALGEADALHPGIPFRQLQAVDEPPELRGVDLVVRREQHGAGADDLDVAVETRLDLPAGLLSIGQEVALCLRFRGHRSCRRQVRTDRPRERTGDREQTVWD